MAPRCVVLDDYQNVALKMADWSPVSSDLDIQVINRHLGAAEQVVEALREATIVCLMRERTPLPRAVIEALPNLKLIVTTGMYNASVDLDAAKERGILVCGTRGAGTPTAELAIGLMLDLARAISFENARLKAGEPWQTTIGRDLAGLTLGVLGLGKLGSRVARIAQAFDMKVIAWSQNLTPERCRDIGVEYVSKDGLFSRSDFVSIHLVLSARTRGLVGSAELGRMKPTACLVNTSRGPIVDEGALIAALQERRIAGAALDVYDREPLPSDHPLRKLSNVVLTPHLGYVTEANYRVFYGDTVEDIRAWLDGKPVRIVTANK
ncbi:MAG TPA: D-2-hydroxyacid dehydrogenase family protein [Xanthobacteraceae bacterium]|nr:D-2-hydroxyacid dehydrogenase family protein [Xanthobacteraceae bacterium]